MSNRPADLLLDDICESIAKIERYTAGLDRAGFEADEKGVDAVVRNLEIIGEAPSGSEGAAEKGRGFFESHAVIHSPSAATVASGRAGRSGLFAR